MSRWLFYSDTPLQIFLASLIACQETIGDDEVELIIGDQFNEASEVARNISKIGIFRNIHFIETVFSKKKLLKIHLRTLSGKGSHLINIAKESYFDYFAFAYSTFVNQSILTELYSQNPRLKVILYEDGLGSYTGNVFNNASYIGRLPNGIVGLTPRARVQRGLSRVFPNSLNRYQIKLFYLRSPELLQYPAPCECREIGVNQKEMDIIASCFKGGSYLKDKKGVLILDGLRDSTIFLPEIEVIDELLQKCIMNKMDILIRQHPASTLKNKNIEKFIDCSGGLWESECRFLDLNHCILVGMASTAQLTPAMTYKKFPPLLFVNWIGKNKASEAAERIIKMAKCLYGYQASEKIFTPTSIDEALEILKSWYKTQYVVS